MKQSTAPRKPGKRGKTRYKISKKGRPNVSVNDIMKDFPIGAKVQIVIESSFHSGLPHKSFHGLVGNIIEKDGSTFVVQLWQGNQQLKVRTSAPHLKELK
jgi:large subunit ribosomal protein L21e